MATSSPLLPGTAGQTYTPYIGQNTGDLYKAGAYLDGRGLTLNGGMTAGWGNNDGNTQNPPLPGSPNGVGINPWGGNPNYPISRVGVLRNVPGSGLPKEYAMNFLYNPGDVQVAFQMDPNAQPPNIVFGGGADPILAAGATTGQTVSWFMIFDRTYDMAYDSDPNGNRGVLKDVGALYLLMGAFASNGGTPMSTQCEVIFGQTDNGDIWGFTGYVSAASIDYAIFRHNMIPSRCQVNITLSATYVSASTPSDGGSGGTAAAVAPGQTSSAITNALQTANPSASSGSLAGRQRAAQAAKHSGSFPNAGKVNPP
jgi:Contractile injection system tube protein